MAQGGQGGHVLHPAQVVGAGEVDAEGTAAFLFQGVQGGGQPAGAHRAGAEAGVGAGRGPQPPDIKVQQGRGIQKGLVGVAGRQQHRPAFPLGGGLQGQKQHGPDALGGAFRPVPGACGAEQPGGDRLALGDDPLGLVQFIRPGNLGQVQGLAAQRACPLVARHMEPGGVRGGVSPHKVRDGGQAHSAQPSPSAQAVQVPPSWTGTSMPWAARSWFLATSIMMAHSIRFLNSSQPYSYTPLMLPVAW